MMRRARWLAAGAVLGALGYQRLHRAARSLASPSEPGSAPRQAVGPSGTAAAAVGAAASTVRVAASTVRVAASTAGHAASATGWLVRRVRRRRAAEHRRHGGIVTFIADVREGMGDYVERHQENIDQQYRRSGNTLVTQRTPNRAADFGGPGGAPRPRPDARGSWVSPPRAGTAGRPRQDDKTKDGR